jgi:hypothetical protein
MKYKIHMDTHSKYCYCSRINSKANKPQKFVIDLSSTELTCVHLAKGLKLPTTYCLESAQQYRTLHHISFES